MSQSTTKRQPQPDACDMHVHGRPTDVTYLRCKSINFTADHGQRLQRLLLCQRHVTKWATAPSPDAKMVSNQPRLH